MAQATLLTDDLLRRLMSVGQVDLVVGLPTLNHAETIAGTLLAVRDGLTRHFPRARTVVIAADGGSRDSTMDIVATAPVAADGSRGVLRTQHQIAAPYRGVPGRASAIRLIFTAADLLQARGIAVFDPDQAGLTPDWIGALLSPVMGGSFDFVGPRHGRHPLESLLATQLIRPVIRAVYGTQLDEPLTDEFGCSQPFVAHCLAQDVWDRSPIRDGIGIWLAGTVLVRDFRVCQARLGARAPHPSRGRPGLADVFPPLVGSLFATLDGHADTWLERRRSEPLPVVGTVGPPVIDAVSVDTSRLRNTFADDVRDLNPVLQSILAPETLAKLSTAAEHAREETLEYPDDTWIATVYDFAAAHHSGVMDRAHIVQALMPLYMARVASFLTAHAASAVAEVARDLEQLSQRFETERPYLVERWNRQREDTYA